jgi:predicted nucleic acid-binding protein
MFVDASAIVAILVGESDARSLARRLEEAIEISPRRLQYTKRCSAWREAGTPRRCIWAIALPAPAPANSTLRCYTGETISR